MEKFSFYGELRSETPKAWLIHDGINEIWIPKAQTELRRVNGDDYELKIPMWLARKKGIIDG